jgi:serine/threonine-protein kinase RsbW
MDKLMCELALTIPRSLDDLNLATTTAQWVCQGLYKPKLNADIAHAVELCVSESCTNAIKHGGDFVSADNVVIIFLVSKDKLIIQVRDEGPGFNFNDLPLPDFDSHPEGGYGIFIIKSMMDEVSYTKNDNYNVLTMIKYIIQ